MTPNRVVYLLVWGLAFLRELQVVAVGAFTLAGAPPSFYAFGVDSVMAPVWSAGLIAGASLCMVGMVGRYRLVEVYGAFLVAAALAVWSVSAANQPDATNTSWAVGSVLAGFASAYAWRGIMTFFGWIARPRW